MTGCAGLYRWRIPGETTGVAAASMLVRCSKAGSADEFVAEMLMHRRRVVAAPARCATLLQGEAAGRSMAVPVNWRAYRRCCACRAMARSGSACGLQRVSVGLRMTSNQVRQTRGQARRSGAQAKHARRLNHLTITELPSQAIGAF